MVVTLDWHSNNAGVDNLPLLNPESIIIEKGLKPGEQSLNDTGFGKSSRNHHMDVQSGILLAA